MLKTVGNNLSQAHKGVRGPLRSSTFKFLTGLTPWLALLLIGFWGAWHTLALGLNQTRMNDYLPFGIWILFDLSVIALGAGAFVTSGLIYLKGCNVLKPAGYLAVLIGFIAYSGAIALLFLDIGQPLRSWFAVWHLNVHSMLTEVAVCFLFYLIGFVFEGLPLILDRKTALKKTLAVNIFNFNLKKSLLVFAVLGALLSFLHQGSLGGLFGVLNGRPLAGRYLIGIWPTTFFLFILSAAAIGPGLLVLIIEAFEAGSKRVILEPAGKNILVGWAVKFLTVYFILKVVDTFVWLRSLDGFSLGALYQPPYGLWLVGAELLAGGLIPVAVLNIKAWRNRSYIRNLAFILAFAGLVINRFVMSIVAMATPVMPFDLIVTYFPSWVEIAVSLGFIGYAGLLISLAYRYLPLFPAR